MKATCQMGFDYHESGSGGSWYGDEVLALFGACGGKETHAEVSLIMVNPSHQPAIVFPAVASFGTGPVEPFPGES